MERDIRPTTTHLAKPVIGIRRTQVRDAPAVLYPAAAERHLKVVANRDATAGAAVASANGKHQVNGTLGHCVSKMRVRWGYIAVDIGE